MSEHRRLEEHAEEWFRYLKAYRPEGVIRLRELLNSIEAAHLQEFLMNDIRLQKQDMTEEWEAGAGRRNYHLNHLIWRRLQNHVSKLHKEFKLATQEAFGPLETVEQDAAFAPPTQALLTDFAPVRQVYLVFPEKVKGEGWDYSDLADFYRRLIKAIPAELEVVLFVKSRHIADQVQAYQLRSRIRCVVHSELESIWLRDYAGFNLGTHLVKPIFSPKRIGDNMKLLHSLLNVDLVALPLVWDGGNLVSNGRYGFISTRLLKHNHKKQKQELLFEAKEVIEDSIRSTLGVEPVWVELPAADKLAHTDGYLTFIAPDKALVSTFPEAWTRKYPDDQRCVDVLARQLQDLGIEVVRIQEQPQDVAAPSPIDSAVGLYVNMLQLNGHWLVPTYGLEGEPKILAQLERLNPGGTIIPIDCAELAQLGGVLHCISFCN